MEDKITRMQEALLALMPLWNYKVAKPFKQLLDEDVSMEMYYCVQMLRWFDGSLPMAELMQYMRMPKQQMTKLVNRLEEGGFVKREYSSDDRRVVRLRLTGKAEEYVSKYLTEDAGYFRVMLEDMTERDREEFGTAVDTLIRVLARETDRAEE